MSMRVNTHTHSRNTDDYHASAAIKNYFDFGDLENDIKTSLCHPTVINQQCR